MSAIKVAMNKQTGALGLIIPIAFIHEAVPVGAEFAFSVRLGQPDGYLIFQGQTVDAAGPWIFVDKEADEVFEILGDLDDK